MALRAAGDVPEDLFEHAVSFLWPGRGLGCYGVTVVTASRFVLWRSPGDGSRRNLGGGSEEGFELNAHQFSKLCGWKNSEKIVKSTGCKDPASPIEIDGGVLWSDSACGFCSLRPLAISGVWGEMAQVKLGGGGGFEPIHMARPQCSPLGSLNSIGKNGMAAAVNAPISRVLSGDGGPLISMPTVALFMPPNHFGCKPASARA